MKVTRTLTVHLSVEEISEIIKEHLAKEGFEAKEVEFNLESSWVGYGTDEHKVEKFTGCDVACNVKTKREDE